MNILIAGIVGVIMLLVGRAEYYTHYIYPEQEQERQEQQRLEQERLEQELHQRQQEYELMRQQRRYNQGQSFLFSLGQLKDASDEDRRTYVIRTEDEFNKLISLCPLYLGQCQIHLSQHLEEERARQILQEHGWNPGQINAVANKFIREPEDNND